MLYLKLHSQTVLYLHVTIHQKQLTVGHLNERLTATLPRTLLGHQDKVNGLSRTLESLSHKSVLKRGFTLLKDKNGNLIRKSDNLTENQFISVEFADNDIAKVTVNKQKTT